MEAYKCGWCDSGGHGLISQKEQCNENRDTHNKLLKEKQMTGMPPKKYQDKMIELPQHLQYASSSKSIHYAEFLSAIDLMNKERGIKLTRSEFENEFGKHGVSGLRAIAKKNKLPFVLRIIEEKDSILFFKNDLPTAKITEHNTKRTL